MGPTGRPLATRASVLQTQLNAMISFATTSNSLEALVGQAFTLSMFTSYTNYTALFDQYRIEYIEAWIVPCANTVLSSVQEVGNYVSVVDLDDAATPSNVISLLNRNGSQVSKLWEGQYHSFRPGLALAAYAGAFTSYASAEGQWLDCGSPSIQYYGLKAGFSTSTTVTSVQLRIRATVTFRGINN